MAVKNEFNLPPKWQPMKAKHADLSQEFTVTRLLSPKLDGIRALSVLKDGANHLLSKSGLLLSNKATQLFFSHPRLQGLDGELIVGDAFGEGVYDRTNSGISTIAEDPQATYHVFDNWAVGNLKYHERLQHVQEQVLKLPSWLQQRVRVVPQYPVHSMAEAVQRFEELLAQGFEGVMLRDMNSLYKFGRATLKQGWLLKMKPWDDIDVAVVGVFERMHNANEAGSDEFGYVKRSSAAAGKEETGMLGGFVCRSPIFPETFKVAPGKLKLDNLATLWKGTPEETLAQLPHRFIKMRYMTVGSTLRARQGRFYGWVARENIDNNALLAMV